MQNNFTNNFCIITCSSISAVPLTVWTGKLVVIPILACKAQTPPGGTTVVGVGIDIQIFTVYKKNNGILRKCV